MIGWAFFGAIAVAPFLREALRAPMTDDTRQNAPGQISALPMGRTHIRWMGAADGPVAVCVHGLTTPSRVWEGLAQELGTRGFRVLAYDHFGRGFSDTVRGRQDRAFFLKHLNEVLANEQVKDGFTLIGYSMGGAIATAFAAENPKRLKQMILLAPAGMGHDLGPVAKATMWPGIGDWLMLALFARGHRKGTETERALPTSVPGIVDYQQAELQRRGFIPAVLSSLRGILSDRLESDHRALEGALPVLAIWGGIDKTIPLSRRDILASWNPTARHATIDDAGHGLTYTHTSDVMRAIDHAG